MPPKPADLRVPPREAPAIERVAAELDLAGRPPADVVKTLRAFFLGRFSYSRYLGGMRPGRTALEDFLLTSRAGHCEYFASATVLLLRQAGIPARYTVGYAAHEWSAIERRWLVRARDAHAWAMAWIDGAWVEVDTTPPEWMLDRGRNGFDVAIGRRPLGVGLVPRSRDGAGASAGTAWPATSAGCCCR